MIINYSSDPWNAPLMMNYNNTKGVKRYFLWAESIRPPIEIYNGNDS